MGRDGLITMTKNKQTKQQQQQQKTNKQTNKKKNRKMLHRKGTRISFYYYGMLANFLIISQY